MPPQPRSSAGDALPQRCQVIEVRVAELRQLFNAIDPSPFRQRDLDPRAEEFIVDWASDLPTDKPWALVVHLDRPAGRADEAEALREAIHEYFGQRVVASRRKLRELFRRGRISLVIALAFLTASVVVGDAVAGYLEESRIGEIIREGFLIGGCCDVASAGGFPCTTGGLFAPTAVCYNASARCRSGSSTKRQLLLTRGARTGPK